LPRRVVSVVLGGGDARIIIVVIFFEESVTVELEKKSDDANSLQRKNRRDMHAKPTKTALRET